jgi:hypothetical protein
MSFIPIHKTLISKNKCRTIKDAVRQTVKALEKKDLSIYMEMWDSEKYTAWLKENPNMDHVTELLENVERYKELHENDFNSLLRQLDKDAQNAKISLKYVSHKVIARQKSIGLIDNLVEIIITVNGKSMKVLAPMVEYKDCVYYFEPIDKYTYVVN